MLPSAPAEPAWETRLGAAPAAALTPASASVVSVSVSGGVDVDVDVGVYSLGRHAPALTSTSNSTPGGS
eukprot:68525-Chlamydomonas_euryale.AAC.2